MQKQSARRKQQRAGEQHNLLTYCKGFQGCQAGNRCLKCRSQMPGMQEDSQEEDMHKQAAVSPKSARGRRVLALLAHAGFRQGRSLGGPVLAQRLHLLVRHHLLKHHEVLLGADAQLLAQVRQQLLLALRVIPRGSAGHGVHATRLCNSPLLCDRTSPCRLVQPSMTDLPAHAHKWDCHTSPE